LTEVSLTYGHGWLNDGDDVSIWDQEHLVGIDAADASISSYLGDIIKVSAVLDGGAADNEYVYYDMSSTINVSSLIYNRYLIRYKTSENSDGLAARVVAHWNDGHTENLLGGSEGVFSSTWAVAEGTISYTSSYIDNIQVWGIKNGNGAGTDEVYYDFILLHKAAFTFPYTHVRKPTISNRYVDIGIPGRVGDVTQYLGMESPTIQLSGKIDIGTDSSWGVPLLDKLYYIMHEAHKQYQPWVWFSTGGQADAEYPERFMNCKVTPRNLQFSLDKDSGAYRDWSLDLKMYSLSCGSEDTWADKQWLGI
jgi:hypothetical protein